MQPLTGTAFDEIGRASAIVQQDLINGVRLFFTLFNEFFPEPQSFFTQRGGEGGSNGCRHANLPSAMSFAEAAE
jgi:hypothetical protein